MLFLRSETPPKPVVTRDGGMPGGEENREMKKLKSFSREGAEEGLEAQPEHRITSPLNDIYVYLSYQ